MAVGVHVGSFVKANTTGNQDITLPAGCPNLTAAAAGSWAIHFFTDGTSGASGVATGDAFPMHGFVANGGGSISEYSAGTFHDHGVTQQTARGHVAAAISFPNINGSGSLANANFVSFPSATSMRINWGTNGSHSLLNSAKINFVIFTGLTNAKVVSYSLGSSAATTYGVSGPGFLPDVVMNLNIDGTTVGDSYAGARMSFGMFNNAGQQWAAGFAAQDGVAGASNTSRWQQTDVMLAITDWGESIRTAGMGYIRPSSFGDTGFHVYTDDAAAATSTNFALCMQGIGSKLGSWVAGATPQTIDSRHNFTPLAIYTMSIGQVPRTTPIATAMVGFGATDLTNARSSAFYDRDNQNPAQVDSMWTTGTMGQMPGTGGTLGTSISLSSADSDSFTVTYPFAASGEEVLYAIFGDAQAAPSTPYKPLGFNAKNMKAKGAGQKHVAVLPSGREFHVHEHSHVPNYALFIWTDNGIDYTDTGDFIDGWSNGSIDTYTDSSGDNYIVATWKQTGTGGGRTDGYVYAMVGILSLGDTNITWSTAVATGASTSFTYPEVIAAPYLTGGRVLVFQCSLSGSTSTISRWVGAVSDSGVLTEQTALATHATQTGATRHAMPSLDKNSNGDAFATWQAGSAGSGLGVRFSAGTFASGAWTFGTERTVDSNRWMSDNLNEGLVVRWDANRSLAVIGLFMWGSTSTYKLQVWDSSDLATFTNRVDEAPASNAEYLFGFGMGIDDSGHVHLFGSRWNGSAFLDIAYRKATRSGSTLTLGSRVVMDAFIGNSTVSPMLDVWINSDLKWRYYHGENDASSPVSIKTDELMLNLPPSAPTLTSPANGSTQDLAGGLDFEGTFNDPGDVISAYYFRIKEAGGSYQYYNAATGLLQGTEIKNSIVGALELAFPAGILDNTKTYNWSFDTEDSAGERGTYASDWTVIGGDPPVAIITGPITTATSSNPTVTWSITDPNSDPQQTYRIIVETGAYGIIPGSGTEVWDSGEASSSAARERTVGAALANGINHRIFLQVKAGNQYSDWDYETVLTSFAAPAAPKVTATPDNANGRISITIAGQDNLLTANQADLEVDTTGWAAVLNTSIARSTAQASNGAASLAITKTVSTGDAYARTPTGTLGTPVVAGQTYSILASFRANTTARTCRIWVQWFSAAGADLGDSSIGSVTDSNGGWTAASVTVVAPANAAYGSVHLQIQSAASGEVHYADMIGLFPATTTTWTKGGLVGVATFNLYRDGDLIAEGIVPTSGQTATYLDRFAPPRIAVSYSATASVES